MRGIFRCVRDFLRAGVCKEKFEMESKQSAAVAGVDLPKAGVTHQR